MAMWTCCSRAILLVALCCLFGVTGGTASADWYEFATITGDPSQKPFSFYNDAGKDGQIYASGDVTFNFTADTGLSTADHDATLLIFTSGGPSSSKPASGLTQHIDGLSTLVLTDDATGKNLLTANFQADLIGYYPANFVFLQDDQSINEFTSDFLTFQGNNDFYLGLPGASAPVLPGPGGFLNSFMCSIEGGTFFSDVVPEPASFGVLGLTALTLVRRRRA